METAQTTIITPSGFYVTLKNDLTYGEYEDLQGLMAQNITLDPTTGKPTAIDFSAVKKANQRAIELIVVEIKKDEQVVNISVRDLPVRDGVMIQREVDKILKDSAPLDEEKKTN